MGWILRLVKIGAEGEEPGTDLMEIRRPDGLGDIADLGLTLSEAWFEIGLFRVTRACGNHLLARPDSGSIV